MSRIYFATKDREVQVYGSERGWLGSLCDKIAMGAMLPYVAETIGPDLLDYAVGFELSDYDRYPGDVFKERLVKKDRFELWARVGGRFGHTPHGFKVGDDLIPSFDFILNTAMVLGNDAIKLAAKLHGTCEDYAWVRSENCMWFAEIIEQARAEGLYRANAGWEDVIELAKETAANDSGPLVTSFSVSDSFPSPYAADWEPPVCQACAGNDDPGYFGTDPCPECYGDPTNWDAWYDLSAEMQWDLSVAGIMARQYNREIAPDTLPIRFLSQAHLFDLIGKPVHEIGPMDG